MEGDGPHLTGKGRARRDPARSSLRRGPGSGSDTGDGRDRNDPTRRPPMSLDTVELVMEMEETFDIVIDDLDAEKIGTVGQAYRYILSRVRLSRDAPCQTASAFYRIRRGLMARTGADRRSIRP